MRAASLFLVDIPKESPVTVAALSKHELPSLAWTLESWVRIPLKAWIFGVCMRLFSVCTVPCLGRGLATS
jgi:hypothetical protein